MFFEPLNIRFDPAKLKAKLEENDFLSARINRALFITKILRIQKIRKGSDAEKLVPSSNLFNNFDLTPGTRVVEEVIGKGKGLIVRKAISSDTKTKKIYSRTYKNRDEIETLMDIRHQEKLQMAFNGAKRVHLLIEHGKVTITPIFDNKVDDRHLELTFDDQDKNALHHALAKTLHIINNHKLTRVSAIIKNGQYKEITSLLDLQLRRQGYITQKTDQGIIAETKNASTHLVKTSLTDFTGYSAHKPNIDYSNPLSTFVACTGGVDAHLLECDDFTVNNLMDFTPIESRDWHSVTTTKNGVKASLRDSENNPVKKLNDKRELCIINALANTYKSNSVAVFNEDAFLTDTNMMAKLSNKHNFLHISPCCHDYSALKSESEREKSSINLTSSRDMFVMPMELISKTHVPVILFENVPAFSKSLECAILTAALKDMGYKVFNSIIKSYDHNCMTNRNRTYIFATLFTDTDFSFPKAQKRSVNVWSDIIKEAISEPMVIDKGYHANSFMRDISHTNSLKKGIESGRDRILTITKDIAPCIPRSQNRQVKDAMYISYDNKYWYPKNKLLRRLMGIPSSFDLSLMTEEVGTEIIGNSLECPQHCGILQQIKKHLQSAIKSSRRKYNYSQLAFNF